jgi:citronellol/citronellal dehydrogenase
MTGISLAAPRRAVGVKDGILTRGYHNLHAREMATACVGPTGNIDKAGRGCRIRAVDQAQDPQVISTSGDTMPPLKDKTLFITGASRGIGKAIALRAARDGARIVIVAKTETPHDRLPGTIYTAAEEIEAAGGQALPLAVDIRFEDRVAAAVEKAAAHFGGIDILVNNASAIQLTPTADTPVKRFDLMHQVNSRGTFICCQACLPFLRKAANPHILMISPPLNMDSRWFAPHVAYTMAKYGMSMCVLGMAEEFRPSGIGVNALWPRTAIATSAVRNLLGGEKAISHCRKPAIMADAAYAVLRRPSRDCSGHFFIDEAVLREEGVTDLRPYQIQPELTPEELLPDFFL